MSAAGAGAERRGAAPRRPPGGVLAAIALFTAASAVLTAALVLQQRNAAIAFWESRLESQAADSRAVVEEWLDERRTDARVLASYPSFVGTFAPDPDHDDHHREHLGDILARFNASERQEAALVVDAGGRVIASAGAAAALVDAKLLAEASQEAAFFTAGGRLLLLLSAPIVAPARPEGRLGAVVLVIDPEQVLWPKLRRAGDPARTIETVFAIEERGKAILLVPLHREQPGEPQLFADAAPNIAARAALSGEPRVGSFLDYRRREVIAATQPIRGTRWGLVRKIDRDEAMAEFRGTAWRIALIGVLANALFAGLLIESWRRQRLRQVETELEYERAAGREQARYQARVDHLLGVIAAARRVNHMLVRETDRQRLLQRTCDLLAQARAYQLAWIGEPLQEGRRVVPRAAAGAGRDYLDGLHVTWDDAPSGQGPTGSAIRLRATRVVRDVAGDDAMQPWQHAIRARGFTSSAAVPITHGERVFGALSVYTADPDIFDEEEIGLLEELADDIGYALQAFELQAENERVTSELRASEARYREISAELEQRVAQRTAELERLNEELTSFNYSVSHDLRAPLRHIAGFSEILLEDRELPPERQRHYLEQIGAGARRMAELIDALLKLSRAGQAALSRRPVDLAALARAAFEELRPPERDVELSIGDLPRVDGDPALLRQVLDNLLGNAIKFTRPRASARIELGFDAGADPPAFFLRDNGVGYDPRYGAKIFDAFQRLHAANEFEGTGIGLNLVRRIVQRHGGAVWSESALGEGSTFYFTLPLANE